MAVATRALVAVCAVCNVVFMHGNALMGIGDEVDNSLSQSLEAKQSRVGDLDGSTVHVEQGLDTYNIYAFDRVRGKKLAFAHIPKNGGTLVELQGHHASMDWGRYGPNMEGQQQMPDGNTCSRYHVPPGDLQGENPYAGDDVEVFCVTRDPWSRMLSQYRWRVKGHYKVGDREQCTVYDFNSWLYGNLHRMRHGERWLEDCHMLPQWEYIVDKNGKMWCHHMLDIANFTSEFNSLMVSFNLPLKLKEGAAADTSGQYCPRLNVPNSDMRKLFWDVTVDAARWVYAVDFEHLHDSFADE